MTLRLDIIRRRSNRRILWTDGTTSYVAKGMDLWSVDAGGNEKKVLKVPGSTVERLLSRFRLSRQLVRLGIHHCWPLGNGKVFLVIRKRALLADLTTGTSKVVHRFVRGNKPAHKGVCLTDDGVLLMGEYVINLDRRHPICVYRSRDGGETFETIKTFEAGDIRHVHFIQWDRYAKCLWMGTGDADPECRLYKSTDQGSTWELVGSGSQLWRAVGIAIRPEALYWGTDAGSDAGDRSNHIVRFDRQTGVLTCTLDLQGPSHGSATTRDGTVLVSTGVEGSANEVDGRAHLWASRNGVEWTDILSLKKDLFPKILQYGVMRFPQGLENSACVMFTAMGLRGGGERSFWGTVDAGENGEGNH
jgi:hypothetical protein